ncbi:transposase domain-containing protein [Pseudomonas helleri]|uniref:transposase domain-containing protein n=1 Tax=Pseudomonas helleri TaxID=1608996 RepID=UPI001885C5C0
MKKRSSLRPSDGANASLCPPIFRASKSEPYAWLRHALERLPQDSSVEDFEALLPWNCTPQVPR